MSNADFLALWRAGVKQTAIAAKLGVSKATVTRWSKELGLEDRRASRQRLPQRIKRLHALGYSQRAIGERLGLHQTTVLYHFRRLGLTPNGWSQHTRERHKRGLSRWARENGFRDTWAVARAAKAIKRIKAERVYVENRSYRNASKSSRDAESVPIVTH